MPLWREGPWVLLGELFVDFDIPEEFGGFRLISHYRLSPLVRIGLIL